MSAMEHVSRERHFKKVSMGFFGLSMVIFAGACVSIGKDMQVQSSSLYAASTVVRPSVQVAQALPSFATRGRVNSMAAGQNMQEADAMYTTEVPIEVVAPQQVPAIEGKNVVAGLGAMALIGGLVLTLRGNKQPPFDPINAVAPIDDIAMATMTGGPNRPTAPKKPVESAEPQITVEYQRKQAKELFEYFEREELIKKAGDGQVFGWTPSNEINNGRWVMFGWLVGMLTEYATGASFVEQIKITLNNLAILDID